MLYTRGGNGGGDGKYPNYIEELMQNSQRQFSYGTNSNRPAMNESFNINNLIQNSKNVPPQTLIQRLQNNTSIHDANPSYLL